jgi:hypothetical protein
VLLRKAEKQLDIAKSLSSTCVLPLTGSKLTIHLQLKGYFSAINVNLGIARDVHCDVQDMYNI